MKASAAKLLNDWQGHSETQGRAFTTDGLAELGQRRQELERAQREVDQQIAATSEPPGAG